MKKFIKNLFSFRKQKEIKNSQLTKKELEVKVQKGISYTIKNYGGALKDLARYDKGEKLVH